jgi:putative transcriptional regulator
MENKIKIFRAINNLTQEQLANETCCTRQTINAIEKGKYSPSLELAFRLAHILDTSIEELFLFTDQ